MVADGDRVWIWGHKNVPKLDFIDGVQLHEYTKGRRTIQFKGMNFMARELYFIKLFKERKEKKAQDFGRAGYLPAVCSPKPRTWSKAF